MARESRGHWIISEVDQVRQVWGMCLSLTEVAPAVSPVGREAPSPGEAWLPQTQMMSLLLLRYGVRPNVA